MCGICKKHNTPEKKQSHAKADIALERNDRTIRSLIDELVSGTQKLKELYTGEEDDRA